MRLNYGNISKLLLIGFIAIPTVFTSCKKERSGSTGWNYNDPKNGGFQKAPYLEQETGPGLVLIEGGRFSMGRTEQDVTYEWNNIPRTVTVSSFYMDEVEVTNFYYLEYLYWLRRVFWESYPEVFMQALPDTLVWREKLAYNEPYVDLYLRHPAYRDYPVVGVNWMQANNFCAWRTDRVNELILIREGLFEWNSNQVDDDNFNTEAYLVGQYESGKKIDGLPNYDPNAEYRNVRMEDGILLPKYRLPTEAEWEYAAFSLIGNTTAELITERKLYPWTGHAVRNADKKYMGQILANFKRDRGDNMGVAGRLNDNADITAPVFSYWPNDYGLYNMAGNVSEWVMDTYRPLSLEDNEDFRPFRGNVFQTKLLDEDGEIAEKDSLGRLIYRDVTPELDNLAQRRNYRQADNINYLDGDRESSIFYDNEDGFAEIAFRAMYHNPAEGDLNFNTLISNRTKVYKGGSWKDRAYWLVPGTRRFLDEDQSTANIGFRCAMTRVGSPVGLGRR